MSDNGFHLAAFAARLSEQGFSSADVQKILAQFQPDKPRRSIVLGMPGYGNQTAAAGRALWCACRDMTQVDVRYFNGSLLACNFNRLWCHALNRVHRGERVDIWGMLHDDVGPETFWLDKAAAILEEYDLDVLGVAVPIKDDHGRTSIAIHHEGDNWSPECRLTMHDLFELPETFTSDDLGGQKLLINTGCWVVKWNQEWCRKIHFTINDRIVFDVPHNAYRPEVESEDWFVSRLFHELGLRIGCTRKIAVAHAGHKDYLNTFAWGTDAFDTESPQRGRRISPVAGAWPYDIPGWLARSEGKALEELAAGKRVLEIGSYCGLSTVIQGRVAKHVTAVDYFDGRSTPQPRNTLMEFKRNIERHGLADKVTICHPDAEIPLPEYDLAFIDGCHHLPFVREDIRKARKVLKPDGLLAFHDYQHPTDPGVEEAVDELLHDGGELLSLTDSLAVVRPPARIPLEV